MTHDMVDAEDEAHKLELAKGAVENTKKHFSDWGLIAQGLWIGQRQAMRAAGSNGPYGGPFKKAMKAWLVANPWAAAYDPPTRTHFIWLHDNRAEVEVWRETLTANQRDQWTHPTTVHRRFEAAHKVPAKDPNAPKKETTLEAQLRENAELWGKVKDLEGQLEERGEGSVIDDTLSALFRKDAKTIGATIVRLLVGNDRFDLASEIRATFDREVALHQNSVWKKNKEAWDKAKKPPVAEPKAIGFAPKDGKTRSRTKAADADEGGFGPGVVEHLKAENKPAKRKAAKATVTS